MVGGEQVQVGTPTVSGAQVHAKVVAHQRGEKTEYTRYLHRRRMRRQKNGRAYLTVLDITRIEA
jgi:large subunit ribosomal protein L21